MALEIKHNNRARAWRSNAASLSPVAFAVAGYNEGLRGKEDRRKVDIKFILSSSESGSDRDKTELRPATANKD